MFEEFKSVRISLVIHGEKIIRTAVSIPKCNRSVNVADIIGGEEINDNIIDITKPFVRRIDGAVGVQALNLIVIDIACAACRRRIVKPLIRIEGSIGDFVFRGLQRWF